MSSWPHADFTASQITRARVQAVRDELRFLGLDSTGSALVVRERLINNKFPQDAAPQQPAVDEPAMDEPAPIADVALPGPSAAMEPDPAEAEPEEAVAVADRPAEAPSSTKLAIAAMPEARLAQLGYAKLVPPGGTSKKTCATRWHTFPGRVNGPNTAGPWV